MRSRYPRHVARVLLALVASIALAGCGGGDAPTAAAPTTAPAAPAEGSPVSGTALDGEAVSLADFRGKPVFVNVWSSW